MSQYKDSWRAVVNAVMNLRVSQRAEIFMISSETVSFSRTALLLGVSYVTPDVMCVRTNRVMFRGRVTLCASSISVRE
jgi:hypothetical protein